MRDFRLLCAGYVPGSALAWAFARGWEYALLNALYWLLVWAIVEAVAYLARHLRWER